MDTGAHFHKCDFQVHSPRDLNWLGVRPVTDEERRDYAEEFVQACRDRGIGAVAITDHHDVAFFRYIKEAAEAETDENGNSLAAADKLVVFPGMELTLDVPCQALLILDSDFPVDLLPQVPLALSITPAEPEDPTHGQVERLEHIKTLGDLYLELDKRDFLRGRYIVFPHVGESGQFSMLRKGMASKYKEMPCVGGYLDGSTTQLGIGNSSILAGEVKEWGNKSIALLQTSDNRSRAFDRLGVSPTWIKWARPTAEALRQACLGKHSRISHAEPALPSVWITSVEVSNSKFMGPVALELNPQYNAVIGGRGTGKSTLLEYVRWALCDQPLKQGSDTEGELADFQRRRKALIDGTLLPVAGVVEVGFELNGVPHVVRRKASGDLSLKIGDNPFAECKEHNVRDLLPVRAYSQKQLSAVGARLEELRRFVHAPIQQNLEAIAQEVGSVAAQLRSSFDAWSRQRALEAELAAHELERRSLSEQVGHLRTSLVGIAPEDSAVISRQVAYDTETRAVNTLNRDLESARTAVRAALLELSRLPTPLKDSQAYYNAALMTQARDALDEAFTEAKAALKAAEDHLTSTNPESPAGRFSLSVQAWHEARNRHRSSYEEARVRSVSHEEALGQIQNLEARLSELNDMLDRKAAAIAKLGEPHADFQGKRQRWRDLHSRRGDAIDQQCQQLNAYPRSRLRATLRRAADLSPLADRLKAAAKGTGTRGAKFDELLRQVEASGQPIETWHEILDEMLELAWLDIDDEAIAVLPSTPRLETAGFNRKDKLAFANQVSPSEWLELLLTDLRDLPIFEYLVKEDEYLPFDQASPGQQATALLSILLMQEGPPLIIDQPEDDLNMRIISDTVQTLWQAKSQRQVLFASHNANLVVNGDAELVICCDYRTHATESGGRIKLTGAIDIPDINKEIAEVMEGGVEAFKLRQQKYGF